MYARERGSIAAPTAGLHFTEALLDGAARPAASSASSVTLHVGYGTFKPVRVERVEEHVVDPERVHRVADGRGCADARPARGPSHHRRRHDDRAGARIAGGRRRTEACCRSSGEATLFIHPGHEFRLVDGLITNFHLPRSSLLMLVAAFAGRERVLAAYRDGGRTRAIASTATATRC